MAEFCNAPFSQFLMAPTGSVHPCCYHFGIKLGSNFDSFQDIWNGSRIKKLRREFLEGKVKTCASRIHNSNCYKAFEHLGPFIEKSEHQVNGPLKLDIRLNGQCNLSCIMCDVWKQPNKRWNESFFWKEGETEIVPFIKEIDVLGGEPFIQQDTFKMIDFIYKINPRVKFSFVTNGQILNFNPIKINLDKIQINKLQISVDATNSDTYRKIRKGGNFDLLLKNIDNFRELKQKHQNAGSIRIVASFCTVIQNSDEIEEFYYFCQERELEPEYQFAFYDPSQSSSLLKLDPSRLRKLEGHLRKISGHDFQNSIKPILQAIHQKLNHC